MSNKKGTKRTIIEIDLPDQESQLGRQGTGRARRSAAASSVLASQDLARQDLPNSPVLASQDLARQDQSNSSGLQPAAAMNSGARTSISPVARGAALEWTANGSQTSTGVDSDGADQTRTPLEDSVSEMVTAVPTTSGESGTISRGEPETTMTVDREIPRTDPMEDPRWEAAVRHRVARASINREAPGTGAIAQSATDGTDGTEASIRATDGTAGRDSGTGAIVREAHRTSGTTQSGTPQNTTRRQRGTGNAEVAIIPEPRTDIEVNGPYWDDHFADVVPESDVEARTRTRLMDQATRRVIHRGRNAIDQGLIIALQDQVDREHARAVAVTEELQRFQQGAHEMRAMQRTHRANSVRHIDSLRQSINTLQLRIRELEAQIVQLDRVTGELRDENKTAQLIVAHHKASAEEAVELERQGSSRLVQERQQSAREIHALNQTIETLRAQVAEHGKKFIQSGLKKTVVLKVF